MSRYIAALDQSTSASKAFLLDEQGCIVARASRPHRLYYPADGYVEQDAEEIYQNVLLVLREVLGEHPAAEISAIALCNQRETTVFWDRDTGRPLRHTVVWQDARAEGLTLRLHDHADEVRRVTGLVLSPYYPAAKIAAVLEEEPELGQRMRAGNACVGTVDSYLIYRLTGGASFLTDASNAGRTQLASLTAQAWHEPLCRLFGVPLCALPRIVSSDADFGRTACSGLPAGIAITGVMGDSHAALFGQGCVQPGQAKATFGTGSSIMMNTGNTPAQADGTLSVCVGYQFQGRICYALEGNITHSGDTLNWLKDELGLIRDANEAEALAATVKREAGLYLVPAFSGLGAPYFEGSARAMLCGIGRGTTRAHIARAALESIAYQAADVLSAMERLTHQPIRCLMVDGAPTRNAALMQFLANLLGTPVQCAAASELSALGAGYMAGITSGVYKDLASIAARQHPAPRYQPDPAFPAAEALSGWRDAVRRCLPEH